ncbi:MAG: lysophospholipid acyltransferase family protein [Gammaproteobacteria bacterium]|nr:lysophospholipid acyltransferase family protein [Gammaproteobacteria bacterium]
MRTTLIKVILKLLSLLPLPIAHAIGAVIGYGLAIFPNKSRQITQTNIQLCFPEFSALQQQDLVKKSLIEMGKSITEIGYLWLRPKTDILKLIHEVSGKKHLIEAMKQNRGAIIAAPHLGTWEVIGLYCSENFPMTILYRPPRLKKLDNMIRTARQKNGAKLVPTTAKGVKSLYKALACNELIGILPDQDPGKNGGIFAPFFNIQTNTMLLLSRLATKNCTPIIFCYAERMPRGKGFHLHFIPANKKISDKNSQIAATGLNADIEKCIRQLPQQYQWSYKRFRNRPEGEKRIY